MNTHPFAFFASAALLALTACSDGEDLPVECRSNADCEVGNCIETICTGAGVGGPSQIPGTQNDATTIEDTGTDAGVDDAALDAGADSGEVADDTAEADVEEEVAVAICDDFTLSAESLVVTADGTTLQVRNGGAATSTVSIISASPVSIFRVTAPSNAQLPLALDAGSSFPVTLESLPGEAGTGVLEIATDVCVLSVQLRTP